MTWFAREARSTLADQVLAAPGRLSSPDLLPIEFAGVLTRKVRRRELDAADVREIIRDFDAINIAYEPTSALLPEAVTLSLAGRHPLYDCIYLALAKRTGEEFATFDTRLAHIASRHGIPLWTPA